MDRQPYLNYRYFNSYSVPVDVQVGIARLELPLGEKIADHAEGEYVRVVARIISDHNEIFKQNVGTYHAVPDEFRNALVWDYVMSFPVKFQSLSMDALLVLTAYRADGSIYGGSSMNFYDRNGLLKQGKQKLVFFFGRGGDASPLRDLNSTPGDSYYSEFSEADHSFLMEKKLESYKVVMMRAQNNMMGMAGERANSSNGSGNVLADADNDAGMVQQLGLGCGLSQSLLNNPDTRLDWLDRMVLTQVRTHAFSYTLLLLLLLLSFLPCLCVCV
jgi:hypothetical protein